MILPRNSIATLTAGAIFGLAAIFLVDGMIVTEQEPLKANRLSFSFCIPAIFTVAGFFLCLLVTPEDVREGSGKAKFVLFVSWVIMFGSTVGVLVLVFLNYCGKQTRMRASPGVELALFTVLSPLAASFLWWGRSAEGAGEDW